MIPLRNDFADPADDAQVSPPDSNAFRARTQSYVNELKPGARRREEEVATSTLPANAAARRLVEALVARGVDTFFGIPGGPICPVFEAIRLTPGAQLVESRHETHAAFAAALFHRASGRVPAVVVTAGPGITNAATGIASASLERAPMLIIAGDVAWATTGGRMAQDSGPEGISIEAMFAPITRAQVRASHSRSVVSQALAALEIACNPMLPGPALFVLPLDRAMGECEAIDLPRRVTRWSAAPTDESVRETAALLREAHRPLLVLGAGCRGHEAAVRALVDACHIPFVTTPRAKGIVSERHPRSLRNGGMAASVWARRYTASPVDVCVALGTDLDDTSMGPTRYVGEHGTLVHVDLDARVFGRNVRTALGVNADLGLFASALCEELGKTGLVNGRARAALKDARSVSPFDVPDASSDDSFPIRPHRLLADLEAAVGPRARFVTDIGEHMLFALHYLTAGTPDAFHVQLNLGSMGSGIAGAIGLALADRSRPVACIAGDGCMQMAGMEALVAIRERLPVLFVVFNDGRYNMVHHGMRQIFGQAAALQHPAGRLRRVGRRDRNAGRGGLGTRRAHARPRRLAPGAGRSGTHRRPDRRHRADPGRRSSRGASAHVDAFASQRSGGNLTISIVGVGTWLPETVRSNDAWPAAFSKHNHEKGDRTFNDIPASEDAESAAIVARDLEAEIRDPFLGVKSRRIADASMTAVEAEAHAALAALRDAGIAPGDVDLVLSYSIVPDRLGPPTGAAVAHRIGATRALVLGVDAACASSITQLDVARAYITAGLARTVLLLQSHLLLRAMPLEHPATPGLGDGATALVVAEGTGLAIRSTFGVTHGEQAIAVTWVRGQTDETDLPWWKAGGDYRVGSRAPERVKSLMRDTVSFGAATIQAAAERSSTAVADIGVIASVMPRGFIPHAIAERLGLPRTCAVTTYDYTAHLGACGPVFNIARARELGRVKPGTLIAMYGQGAGFTRAAAILEAQ